MPPVGKPFPYIAPTQLIPDPRADLLAGLNVVSAKELNKDAFNALFYAYPGVGKTTLAGMFADYPAARDVLIADAEGGASVLSHRDHVDVVQLQKWADVERLLTYFERTPVDTLQYRTVCWDNITELANMHMTSIVGNNPPGIQDYGRNTQEIMRFVRRVRDLSRFKGINTLIIGWQDTKTDKNTSVTRQTIALTEKLSTRVPGIPNNVGYITVLNNPPLYTRRLSFAASPLNDAKFRRAGTANSIPDDIYYGIDQNPIVDILRTIYEDVPFPIERYLRPKGRTKPQEEANVEAPNNT